MNKYITIVELDEDATDFAQIIGIRGFELHDIYVMP